MPLALLSGPAAVSKVGTDLGETRLGGGFDRRSWRDPPADRPDHRSSICSDCSPRRTIAPCNG